MYTLRDYQQEAVYQATKFIKENKNKTGGVLMLPTGAGKSLVIERIANGINGHTVVFQPNKEILEQNLQKMYDAEIFDVGVFSASCGRKDISKITFATIGSVKNQPELFDHFENVIVDECHEVNPKGGMYADFFSRIGVPPIGLSATPMRNHAYEDYKTGEPALVAKFITRTNPRIFGKILHVTQVGELYERGYLCPIKYHINDDYDQSVIKKNSTGADFDEKALKRYNEEKGLVTQVREAIQKTDSEHILVFCKFVEEAERLSEELNQLGIRSATVSTKTRKKEREEILAEFKCGIIKVVTNVGVLTTGFDFPELDCVILARPTKSVMLYYQMVGRGIRIADGKEYVNLVDICGNVERFGQVETFEVVTGKGGANPRLKSDKGFLTGLDFNSGRDVEMKGYEDLKEKQGFGNPDVIPFGKYKGTHITKLPTDYIQWCIDNFDKSEWQKKFMDELARRLKGEELLDMSIVENNQGMLNNL